jgi:monoamine oxidase
MGRLRRQGLTLNAEKPWDSTGAAELDGTSLADWLLAHGATQNGLDLTEAVFGGFATRSIAEVSAAHTAAWIAAGGLLAAIRSGQHYVVPGGVHQIPRRLAAQLRDQIAVRSPVNAITSARSGVEVTTADDVWAAGAAIAAVPLPALQHITLDPAPGPGLQSAIAQLTYGRAIKIAATTAESAPVPHRFVVGGHPLAIAWRHHRVLAGIATAEYPVQELLDDLATSFGVEHTQLHQITVTDWTRRQYIGGSYLIYRPGQMTSARGRPAPAPLQLAPLCWIRLQRLAQLYGRRSPIRTCSGYRAPVQPPIIHRCECIHCKLRDAST